MSLALYNNLDKQFINGHWVDGQSDKTIKNINPYNNEVLCSIKSASIGDVDDAFNAAQSAFATWSQSSKEDLKTMIERAINIVETRRAEIVDWLIKESGSTRMKSEIEVSAALNIMTEAATFPDRMEMQELPNDAGLDSRSYRQALGVIGVITPWNFPFHLSMRSVVTALAIGNTVVIKPASDTVITGGTLLAKIFEEAGAPAGTINVVAGSGSEIGDYFVLHAIPKFISFTGSTKVGKQVGKLAIGGDYLKRIALELGGNSPLVVLDDANLDMAVELAVMGRFMHQGQVCMSTNRVIVDDSVYNEFVEKLLTRMKSVTIGDPDQEDTLIGPIINSKQFKNIIDIIESGKQSGAKLVLSGEIKNNMIPPHIFTEVDPKSTLALDESFGPVLPIIKARNEELALELANATEYGLSSAVCTEDRERGIRFGMGIDAGMTHINGITVADQQNAPFGGEKNSGIGRFNGQWILEELTRTHWISVS